MEKDYLCHIRRNVAKNCLSWSSKVAINCSKIREKNSVLFSLTDENSFHLVGIFTLASIFRRLPKPLSSRVAFFIESVRY